jgi:hypothetical protein
MRFIALLLLALMAVPVRGQDVPYFVAYSDDMQEPGSLEIGSKMATGKLPLGNRFFGDSVELEYGTTAWWTSELYLDVTGTTNESTVFGGFRLENRFHPLALKHWINPVLYTEFEDINGADKSVLEVVGHDGKGNLATNSSASRKQKEREVELKLILSSDAKSWNFSENLIFEKNLSNTPWEFGYALGVSHPLRSQGTPDRCVACLENVSAGAELYGGLGDRYGVGTRLTSQYLGPVTNWQIPHGPRFSLGTGFGLNDYSLPRIYRVGIAYEPGQVGTLIHRLLAR